MKRPGMLLHVSLQACHRVENLSALWTRRLPPTGHVLVDPSVGQQGRLHREGPGAVGALVRSLLSVDPHMADQVAWLLELSVAEGARVEPDSLLQPGLHQVLPHLAVLQAVSQHHLALLLWECLALLTKSSRSACDRGLDCAREQVAALISFSSSLFASRILLIDGSFLNPRLSNKIVVSKVHAFWLTVWMKTGDMSVQTAKAFEHTSALLALISFIPIQIVHSQNVSPQVSPLGELHAAEAASVRLLPCVPQDVSVKRLFLCESFSTLCTLERAHPSVDSLMARNLAWFAELLTAELATQFERVSCHRTFSLLDQLQT